MILYNFLLKIRRVSELQVFSNGRTSLLYHHSVIVSEIEADSNYLLRSQSENLALKNSYTVRKPAAREASSPKIFFLTPHPSQKKFS